MTFRHYLIPVALWFVASAPVVGQIPIGEEIDLRAEPVDCGHLDPALAFAGDGSLFVAWKDTQRGLVSRGFPAGAVVPGELAVLDGDPTPHAPFAAVAGRSDGTFVVAWTSGPFGAHQPVWQRFDVVGHPITDRIPFDAPFPYEQAMATLPGDGHAIAAIDTVPGATPGDVTWRVKLFSWSALGEAVGSDIAYESPADLDDPRLAVSPDGTLLVSWLEEVGSAPERYALRARVFSPEGAPLSGPWTVFDRLFHFGAAVAPLPSGRFLFAWQGVDLAIYSQAWEPAGTPQGDVQLLGEAVGHSVSLAGPPSAGPFAAWVGLDLADDEERVLARSLAADGSPLGVPVPVSLPLSEVFSEPTDLDLLFLRNAEIDAASTGRIATAWQIGVDSPILPSECEVGETILFRQLFGPGLFIDGFESGDVESWSAVVGTFSGL